MMTQENDTSAPKEAPFERPRTILVADDEHLVAMGMKNNLEELGYNVIGPANNGAEASDLCRELQPDLALLDIQMPGMNGIEAANTIFNEPVAGMSFDFHLAVNIASGVPSEVTLISEPHHPLTKGPLPVLMDE